MKYSSKVRKTPDGFILIYFYRITKTKLDKEDVGKENH